MESRLKFDVDGDTGCFVYPDERFGSLKNEFDELLDAFQSGNMDEKRYITELSRLITLNTDFIDLHAHLSYIYLEQGKPKKALDAALAGLAVGNRLIPEGFSGIIEWGYLENRPFLRALQGALLAYTRLRRYKDAATLIDKMLAYNSDDNHGNRYLLGSALMRAGDEARALENFNEYVQSYPPYRYELALLHILNENWVSAATELRRGFNANCYIAEILGGNYHPQPLAIWHGSNLAEPAMAHSYIENYGDLWFRHPEALVFVRWLFNHSSIMSERALLMKCNEELFIERSFDIRGSILDRQGHLVNEIDDRLSKEIIKKTKGRQGKANWPWLHTL